MRITLKQLPLAELEHDLRSLEFDRREMLITEQAYRQKLGKLTKAIETKTIKA